MIVNSRIPTARPAIQMLSDEQVREIHTTSMDILARTGIEMRHEAACEMLLNAGAVETGGRIKIPEHLIMGAVATAPGRIPMHNRLGQLTMPLEGRKTFYGTGSDCIYTHDIETGERRFATADDVQRIAHVCDGLDHISFVMSMGTPSDVPTMDHYLHSFIRMIRGSGKPLLYTANGRRDMEDIYAIAVAVVGGEAALRERPFLLHYAEPISPLLFNTESVDKLLFCAEKGIPVTYPPSPNPGGGGPVTLAGAIALGNAETLVGLLLAQLERPGTPFLYGMNTAALDMKSTIISYGSPEWAMGMPAWTDVARFYGLPSWGAGGASDSKLVDAQAAIESTVTIMMAALSGCNLIHDVGYIEYGSTSSVEQIVIADEIIREVAYILNGVEVSERSLAREAIHTAQPGGGFLAADHTLDHWKWAQWRPDVIDRERYDRWEAAGRKDMTTRANEKARRILADHEVAPLARPVEDVIADILARRATEEN